MNVQRCGPTDFRTPRPDFGRLWDRAAGTTFLVDSLLFFDERLGHSERPDDIYPRLDAIAAEVPAGSAGVIFTPWLNGERTPVDDDTVRGGLHNLSTTTTRDHVIRAVLEGVALNTRWSLKYVERFCGRRLDPLRIVGGGARSDIWCQIFADVLDREIHQVTDPMQANARGAALIAAVGLGHTTFDRVPGLVDVQRRFRPDPGNRELYDELFAVFVELYKANKGIFKRLNRRD